MNINQNVDREDFSSVVMSYDPLGHEPFHEWGDGNFDGDDDVDFIDAMRVVANFAPLGYPLFGSLSTDDKSNGASLIADENGNGVLDTGTMEPLGRRSDRPKPAEDGTAHERHS